MKNFTAYFEAKEAAAARKKSAHVSVPDSRMNDMMMLDVKMQQDRQEREDECGRQDAAEMHNHHMKVMQLMAAIMNPALMAAAAASA